MGLFGNLKPHEMEQLAGLFGSMPAFGGGRNAVQPLAGYWAQAGERAAAAERQKIQEDRQKRQDELAEQEARRRAMLEQRDDSQFNAMGSAMAQFGGGRGLDYQSQRKGILGDADMPGEAFSQNMPEDKRGLFGEVQRMAMAGNPYAQTSAKLFEPQKQSETPASMLSQGYVFNDPNNPSAGVSKIPGYNKDDANAPAPSYKEMLASKVANGTATPAEKAAYAELNKSEIKFSDVSGMRKEVVNVEKDFRDSYQNYQALKNFSKSNSGESSVAMIFNFMKMLDPTSVVREGEQMMVMRTDGLFGTLGNMLNKAMTGEALNDEQRKELVNVAGMAFKPRFDDYTENYNFFKNAAVKRGVDIDEILKPYTDLNAEFKGIEYNNDLITDKLNMINGKIERTSKQPKPITERPKVDDKTKRYNYYLGGN